MSAVLDIVVRVENYEEDVVAILKEIRPTWQEERILIKEIKGGLMNKLLGCRLKDDEEEEDMVLVRVYGKETQYIDRDNEILVMRVLHQVGSGEPVYCRFTNGMAYRYCPGICLNADSIVKDNIARAVAKEMARFKTKTQDWRQALAAIGEKDKADVFWKPKNLRDVIDKFVDMTPEILSDPEQQARFAREVMNKDRLREEARYLGRLIEELQSTAPFLTHFDIWPQNMIYDDRKDRVKFIDWEFGCILPLAFDIGTVFAGIALSADADNDKYPSDDFQKKWLRWFLEFKSEFEGKDPSEIPQKDLDDLHADARRMALAWLFICALWAFGQIENPSIDFDYISFGRDVLNLYLKRKELEGFP